MRYTLVEYDVRAEKHLSAVRDWRRWADGQVPALELDGNGKVRQYVGVQDFRKLAEQCKEWLEASIDRRRTIEPVEVPVKAKTDYSKLTKGT